MEDKCDHNFELSRITTESTADNMFYHQVGYAVCTKCGEIRKQNV